MIAKACAVSNGVEREIAVESKETEGEYAHINMILTKNGNSDIISQIRLYDAAGALLAEKNENIMLHEGFDSIMYRMTIRIIEV